MSFIKSAMKSFLRLIIQLLKPFGLFVKFVYQGLKAVIKPVIKGVIYLFKQLWILIKWISISFYKVLFYPIYFLFKKLFLGIYYVVKQLSIFIYRFIIKPLYFLFKKIIQGLYYVIKQIAKVIYHYILKPLYILVKKIFKGFWFVISQLSIWVYKLLLKPFYRLMVWIYIWLSILFESLWKILTIMGQSFKKVVISLFNWIKPGFIWIFNGIKALFKGVRFIFIRLFKVIISVMNWVLKGLMNILFGIKYVFEKTMLGIKTGFLYLYDYQPEWLYNSFRWLSVQVILFMYTLLWWVPKKIFVDALYQVFKFLWVIFKKSIYYLVYLIQRLMIALANEMTKLKQFTYPLKRVLIDLVYDFKDYYYIWLLSPILLPIFIVFGVFVWIYVLLIHVWILIKALFNIQEGVLRNSYLPSLNVFKFSQIYILKQKRTMGYQQKLVNAISLMVLFLWPFNVVIRIGLALILLPWTILVGLFHLLMYAKNNEQIDFIVDDFIKIPDKVYGIIPLNKIKLYGHEISLHVEEALFDKDLECYVINPEVTTFRLEVLIDGNLYQAYTIKHHPTNKTSLLYEMNRIQKALEHQQSSKIQLPKFDDLTINYQRTHQGDDLTEDTLYIRSHANHTDLNVKVVKQGLSYEKEVRIETIQTDVLERILSIDVFYGYQGLSVKTFLDPKLSYIFLPNEHLDKDIIRLKVQHFSVTFKVVGLDYIYQMHIQIIPSPLDSIAFKRVIQKPLYDQLTHRFTLPTTIAMFGLIHPLEWFVDGVSVELEVALNDLEIIEKHQFYVKVFDGYKQHETTFTIKDERFKTAIWATELNRLLSNRSDLCLNDGIYETNRKRIHLPKYGLKYIKQLRYVSQNKNQIRSTGVIKQSGVSTLKVIMYQRLFVKKVVFIQIRHEKNEH